MVALSLEILGLGVLLVLSAFFSGSESALFSLSKLQLQRFERSKDQKEQNIADSLSRPKRLIIDIVIGNNILNIAASSLATVIFLRIFGEKGLGVAILVMTILLLIFGEITPKTIAVEKATAFSKFAIGPLRAFSYVTAPFRWIFFLLSEFTVNGFGHFFKLQKQELTEDELKTILEVSEREGVLDANEKEMITGVLDFTDTTVDEIMTPRVDVIGVNAQWSQTRILRYVRSHKYSKLPVYNGSIDKITGYVLAKEVLFSNGKNFKKLLRPIIVVPETKKIHLLLKEFQKKNQKIAVVLDEYGGTEGIITLEDILEEIFGEIHDEFEEEIKEIVKLKRNEYRVLGKALLSDLNEEAGTNFSDEDYNTLNGYLIGHLGRLPKKHEVVRLGRWSVKVEKILNRKVQSVLLFKGGRKK